MTLSSKLSSKPSAVSKAIVAVLVLGTLGFIDASYLTVSHYFRIPLPCSIVNGCETVTTSIYSTVFGIPVALLGAAYYLAIVLIAVFSLDRKNTGVMKWVRFISAAGFLASLIFVSLQLFVLHAICLYCMTSAVTTTAIFIFSALFFAFPDQGNNKEGNQ